jgi:hypothetical protein
METLTHYAEEIQNRSSSPHELAELLVFMSVDFAQANNNKIHYSVVKAKFINENKGLETEKPLSDSAVNAKFMTTKDGIEHTKNEIYIKTMTSLMSNIKAALRNLENEAKNQF